MVTVGYDEGEGADKKNFKMKVPSIQSIVKWIHADYIYRQKIENQKQINDHNGSYNFLFECEAKLTYIKMKYGL